MRLEFANHLASSCLSAFRMLQDVVDPKDLNPSPVHVGAGAAPNLSGCVDSPEAASMILMVVGAVGIYYGSSLFLRMMRRRAMETGV